MAVLDDHQIDYMIDSGILLGLEREGRLLAWEKDIDLAVTVDQADRLLAVTDAFADIGYVVSVNRYKGLLWSIGLKPSSSRPAEDLRAAVHVYHRTGDHLWSPQPQIYVPPPAPDVFSGRRSVHGQFLRWLADRFLYSRVPEAEQERESRAPDATGPLHRISQFLFQRIDTGTMAESWLLGEVYVPYTWVVPAELVLPYTTMEVGGVTFPVPTDVDGYLTHRYGQWREPVTEWCYWIDDGAIVNQRPGSVRVALEAGIDPLA